MRALDIMLFENKAVVRSESGTCFVDVITRDDLDWIGCTVFEIVIVVSGRVRDFLSMGGLWQIHTIALLLS